MSDNNSADNDEGVQVKQEKYFPDYDAFPFTVQPVPSTSTTGTNDNYNDNNNNSSMTNHNAFEHPDTPPWRSINDFRPQDILYGANPYILPRPNASWS
ncbi:uncharacterized protein I303_108174 [Kwoniella dejecticola CBS 10117]|uniref:Uncharacterized protein n=1 Tax=Kwoniella dejecticola CBS 10117 TaxID=1296121 RepID=A0A1A5ZY74_9TREE|nr:uncharacterized protein I303_07500 [Kwoniella dejecticola CBS 10117]OBR82733.1 hypothetical protein I303_07500 [Kwoniella dejecticola CBS 10117]